MSVEEDETPTNPGPRIAWGGDDDVDLVDTHQDTPYSTWETNSTPNNSNVGVGYNVDGGTNVGEDDMEDLRDQMSEMKLKHETEQHKRDLEVEGLKKELEFWKEQLRAQPEAELKEELIKKDREIRELQGLLDISKEKELEYEQEMMLKRLHSSTYNSMSSTSSEVDPSATRASPDGGDARVAGPCPKCEEVKRSLRDKQEELERLTSELGAEKTQLEQELGQVSTELEAKEVELDRATSQLKTKKAEVDNLQYEVKKARRDSEEGREGSKAAKTPTRMQEQRKKKLEEYVRKAKESEDKLKESEERRMESEVKMRENEEKFTAQLKEVESRAEETLAQLRAQYERESHEKSVQLEAVSREKTALEQKQQGEISEMSIRARELQQSLQLETGRRLEAESRLNHEKRLFQEQQAELEASNTELQASNRNLESAIQISQQKQEEERLEHERRQEELESQLERGHGERDRLLQQKDVELAETERRRDELQTKVFQLEQAKNKLVSEKHKLVSEKHETEMVCDGFKEEAERTIEDYNRIANELAAEKKKSSQYMNNLSRRTEEVGVKDGQIEELRQKITALTHDVDKAKREAENATTANKLQLEMMQQDYVTERRAREKAAKTMQEMRGEIDRLRRDNAEMREVLNSQAASHFSQEFAED